MVIFSPSYFVVFCQFLEDFLFKIFYSYFSQNQYLNQNQSLDSQIKTFFLQNIDKSLRKLFRYRRQRNSIQIDRQIRFRLRVEYQSKNQIQFLQLLLRNHPNPKQKVMVKFTVEQVREIMDHQDNIRNMSVIAHVDHGKSTLSDALICKAGILSEKQAGNSRAMDNRKDEIERGITIKSTGVSLYYEHDVTHSGDPAKIQKYLINLIDSPGHVDFSSEVTAALRVTDGALVVVDTIEGVCVQTQTVMRQAMQEKIKPVVMINKVDRAILELKMEGEDIYQQFSKVIDKVNVNIATYQSEDMGDLTCEPTVGNVAFGAGKDQWAFTLRTFARFYSRKFGINEDKMMKKLWGDVYFNPQTNKFTSEEFTEDGKKLPRTFVEFIIDPILKLCRAIMSDDKEAYEKLLEKLEIKLTADDRKQDGKALLKIVMSRWLSAADCLMEMMIMHLPSPRQAQAYRTSYLYEGPNDDIVYESMRKCDPKGPLVVYISKLIPVDGARFAAFGRVFSGTVQSGQSVKILGSNYKIGSTHDLYEKNISQVGVYMMGRIPESVHDVPCGNTVAIMGIDNFLLKTGTICSPLIKESYPIRSMKYSVSPVYRVAIKVKNPADLPKLEKGLKKLSKSDPLLKVEYEETGEIVIAGSGELHIEICINDLKEFAQCEIIVSEPSVTYKETITEAVSDKLLTKSANKHNRFFGTTELLDSTLVEKIQEKEITQTMDVKERTKILVEQFAWDKNDAHKIWCFGPENSGPNILVDQVKQAQYMNEVKDSVVTAFQSATRQGVLAEENVCGIRFNIVDSTLHQESVHRNGAQIEPCSKRLFRGLQLASKPTLLEPIFLVEITAPADSLGGVYKTINQRRGEIIDEVKQDCSPLHIVKAYLPVSESFGLSSVLRSNTQGKAFPNCVFDHWEKISGMPYEDVKADEIVRGIRKRKGLKLDLPILQDYVDKL